MLKKHLYIIACCILIGVNLWAQPFFEVKGIMMGELPIAVVNDKIVRVGDSVENAVIEEIGRDYVKFSVDSDIFTTHLKNFKDLSDFGKMSSGGFESEAAAQPSFSRPQDMRQKNLDSGYEYIKDAQRILGSKILSVKLYDSVLALYDKSEQQYQYALNKTPMDEKEKIKKIIRTVGQYKDAAYKGKQRLQKDIRDAIRNKTLVYGMTASDVRSSIGSPNSINHSGGATYRHEQWIYRSSRNMYLYFELGVLVSYQYF